MALDVLACCRPGLGPGCARHEPEGIDGQRHLIVARGGKGLAAVEAFQLGEFIIVRFDRIGDGQQHAGAVGRGRAAEAVKSLGGGLNGGLDLGRAGLLDRCHLLPGRRIKNRGCRALAFDELAFDQ